MNTGLVASFAIGGFLLIAILFLNLNMSQSSTSLTMRQITRQNIEATSEILEHDLSKIGFEQFKNITDPIKTAESNKIVFKSDIDNSGSPVLVEWFFDTSAPLTSSENSDAHTLERTVDGSKTDIAVGITAFKLSYLDKDLAPITAPVSTQTDRNKIRHIKIEMTVSSKEKLGGAGSADDAFIRSFYTKTISPKNIK